MAYNSDSIASGAFFMSGHWFSISGTLAQVRQILNVENIPGSSIKGVTMMTTSGNFVYIIGYK